jgi:tetratricopeptide (TPR) repeat protein
MSEPNASRGPYVGPRPFRRNEAHLFFGRSEAARLIRDAWLAERVVILHGAAAVGKTSLLHAGVYPLLSDGADGNPPHTVVLPTGRLVHQATWPLAHAGNHRFTLLSSWAPAGQVPDQERSISATLHGMTAAAEPRRILAAVDHFEELFITFPARLAERERLIGELTAALRELPLNLLLIVRDDNLAALSGFEGRLTPQPFTYLQLEGLAESSALAAVTGPVDATGRRFASGVAESLVQRLRTATYTDRMGDSIEIVNYRVAPFDLQIACSALWAGLADSESVITMDHLEDLGDPDRVLATFFDRAVRDVSVETGQPERDLRSWIESTFVTERGTRGSAYRGVARTADLPNAVVDALVARHILIQEQRAGSIWYQLAQERLIAAVRTSSRNRQISRNGMERNGMETTTPANSPADFRMAAEAALGEGNFISARRFAEVAARRSQEQGDDRQFAHLLAFQGEVAIAEGDLESAHDSLLAARSEFETLQDAQAAVRVLTELAQVCLSMDSVDEAVELGRQAVERVPADVDARVVLAYAFWRAGSPADAEAVFNDALDLDRNAAGALLGRGRVRIALRDYRRALVDLDRALRLGLPRAEEDLALKAREEAQHHLDA